MEPSIKLPATMAIGFTGHRTLGDETNAENGSLTFLPGEKLLPWELCTEFPRSRREGPAVCRELHSTAAAALRSAAAAAEEFRKDFDAAPGRVPSWF